MTNVPYELALQEYGFPVDQEATNYAGSIAIEENDKAFVITVSLPDFHVEYKIIGEILAIFGIIKNFAGSVSLPLSMTSVDNLNAVSKVGMTFKDGEVTSSADTAALIETKESFMDPLISDDFEFGIETTTKKECKDESRIKLVATTVAGMTAIKREKEQRFYQRFCHPIKLPLEIIDVETRHEWEVDGNLNILMPKKEISEVILHKKDQTAMLPLEDYSHDPAHRKASELHKFMEIVSNFLNSGLNYA
ncbi:hypothetical protein G9A89_007154 [Geosiphon pyriformis]|nr:hypothetical protein G9A89_007154 [Geosiphon pyriformis]